MNGNDYCCSWLSPWLHPCYFCCCHPRYRPWLWHLWYSLSSMLNPQLMGQIEHRCQVVWPMGLSMSPENWWQWKRHCSPAAKFLKPWASPGPTHQGPITAQRLGGAAPGPRAQSWCSGLQKGGTESQGPIPTCRVRKGWHWAPGTSPSIQDQLGAVPYPRGPNLAYRAWSSLWGQKLEHRCIIFYVLSLAFLIFASVDQDWQILCVMNHIETV